MKDIWWRSLAFTICFIGWALLSSVIFLPFGLFSTEMAARAGRPWALGVLWLAEKICGIRYEIRGEKNISYGPVIYASKHQSAWDTAIFLTLFRWPAYILKRELLWLPLWGWYLWRMKMIAIDRGGRAASLKAMVRQAKDALYAQRPIVIYPEGTRTAPGAPARYQIGVAALYSQLHVPVIPVALNSGLYWGKNAFLKTPGTIIIEFLPPIEAGLEREEFMAQLQGSIETASQKLLEKPVR